MPLHPLEHPQVNQVEQRDEGAEGDEKKARVAALLRSIGLLDVPERRGIQKIVAGEENELQGSDSRCSLLLSVLLVLLLDCSCECCAG